MSLQLTKGRFDNKWYASFIQVPALRLHQFWIKEQPPTIPVLDSETKVGIASTPAHYTPNLWAVKISPVFDSGTKVGKSPAALPPPRRYGPLRFHQFGYLFEPPFGAASFFYLLVCIVDQYLDVNNGPL